jgi:mRNA-degrading endonuclease toxin of MazEF toxin-antitoxin module
MTKGEIWGTELPVKGGHVQRGVRPALILADATKSIALVIPLTSALAAQRFPHTLFVAPTTSNGLEKPSVLLLFQLGAIDKRFLHRSIGTLDEALKERVDEKLRALIGV